MSGAHGARGRTRAWEPGEPSAATRSRPRWSIMIRWRLISASHEHFIQIRSSSGPAQVPRSSSRGSAEIDGLRAGSATISGGRGPTDRRRDSDMADVVLTWERLRDVSAARGHSDSAHASTCLWPRTNKQLPVCRRVRRPLEPATEAERLDVDAALSGSNKIPMRLRPRVTSASGRSSRFADLQAQAAHCVHNKWVEPARVVGGRAIEATRRSGFLA